jgi:hypothetical protein
MGVRGKQGREGGPGITEKSPYCVDEEPAWTILAQGGQGDVSSARQNIQFCPLSHQASHLPLQGDILVMQIRTNEGHRISFYIPQDEFCVSNTIHSGADYYMYLGELLVL